MGEVLQFDQSKRKRKISIPVEAFLTPAQIEHAKELGRGEFIAEYIIEPNLEEIQRKFGRKEPARFFGYYVEYMVPTR